MYHIGKILSNISKVGYSEHFQLLFDIHVYFIEPSGDVIYLLPCYCFIKKICLGLI